MQPLRGLKLLLAVNNHGLGHLSQCVPVIRELRTKASVQLSVRSGFSQERLTSRLGPIEHYLPTGDEIGVHMTDAATVDAAATLAHYRELHARLPEAVEALADEIRAMQCDVVVCNVSYIAAAAASLAGVPSVVYCSLSWHEIVASCWPQEQMVTRDILACYRRATRVLRLEPGTPFNDLDAKPVTQPIAQVGRARRAELAAALKIAPDQPIALLSFSVLPAVLPPLVHCPGRFALVGPAAWQSQGVASIQAMPLPYEDLLASVDVVVSKAGYSTTAELGCTRIPAVMVDRPGWIEQRYLLEWLQAHGRCRIAARIEDVTEDLVQSCMALPMPAGPAPRPGGELVVAQAVLEAAAQRRS